MAARSRPIGMYLDHFGMRGLPFSLTPDTSYFVACPSHREALNLLLVALRSGEGFTKIVGEVGTGKTLLCRKLLRLLEGRFATAYIQNPLFTPSELVRALAEAVAVKIPVAIGSHRLLELITTRLLELDAGGEPLVLLLDEAQAMPEKTLEAVRLLTNLETETRKLLQVVLFGQPELDARLARPSLRQLRQRITFSHRLRPLTHAELARYVERRLRVAGCLGRQLFTPAALGSLFHASRGVPRLVNILCHKALLAAYGCGDARVGSGHVRRAVADTEGVHASNATRLGGRWIGRFAPLKTYAGAP